MAENSVSRSQSHLPVRGVPVTNSPLVLRCPRDGCSPRQRIRRGSFDPRQLIFLSIRPGQGGGSGPPGPSGPEPGFLIHGLRVRGQLLGLGRCSEKTLGSQEGPVMFWKSTMGCGGLVLEPNSTGLWELLAKHQCPGETSRDLMSSISRLGTQPWHLLGPGRPSLKSLLCLSCLSTADHMTSFLEPVSPGHVDLIPNLRAPGPCHIHLLSAIPGHWPQVLPPPPSQFQCDLQ